LGFLIGRLRGAAEGAVCGRDDGCAAPSTSLAASLSDDVSLESLYIPGMKDFPWDDFDALPLV
jgi:hypothetical protein